MLAIGNPLNFGALRELSRGGVRLSITEAAYAAIERGSAAVAEIVKRGEPAYGVNTGFGRLAQTHIPNEQLELLQSNLVLSHAVGVGNPLPAAVVRLTLALKIATLARGYSGVRRVLIDALVKLYNADVLPLIPSKGSVGASGDLAPLAHLSAVLLGVGEVVCDGKTLSADEGLARAGLTRIKLAAKEGLALLNGTQVSTALALVNLFSIDNLYSTALVAGALSVDAAEGSASPFDARIHELRGHPGQIAAARAYREAGGAGPVTLLTAEPDAPYVRPLLSKELLRGETDEAALEDDDWFAEQGVELRREAAVEALDPGGRNLRLAAQRVGILDLAAIAVTGVDGTAC